MQYDFDRELDRQGTNSVKWEFIQEGQRLAPWHRTDPSLGEDRILPMWVADMDFPCPAPVVQALVARAHHGIFGYTERTDSYFASIVEWMRARQGWEVSPEWIVTTPGVVPALNMLVRAFVAPGEKVLIQPPVYYPFYRAIEGNQAAIVRNPLVNANGRYHMDFDDLAVKLQDPLVRMVILCSPHNPVGRVWTRDELTRFGELCVERRVLVVSDEIHGDLVHAGNTFTPFAALGNDFCHNLIICTAPSKTFNIAGLQTSNILIPNESLRRRFAMTLLSNGLMGVNPFGLVALQAAYRQGADWLDQVIRYLGENLRFLEEYIQTRIPQISVVHPEGTYLVWLDCRRLGLDKQALQHLMLDVAKVYLDEGFIFGPEGEGYERMNIACPRSILAAALARIERAIHGRPS